MTTSRSVLVLGSTGSVGAQALDVAARNPHLFTVAGIAAGGSDPRALAAQALAHGGAAVAVSKPTAVEDLQLALYAEAQRRGYSKGEFRIPRIFAGGDSGTEPMRARALERV